MKLLLICLVMTLTASAQTSTYSNMMSQINDDDQTLSIQISGEKDGRAVEYTRRFNVVGMSQAQKDALKSHVLDSLGVSDVIKPPIPLQPPRAGTEIVTFECPTCTGKGRLEVYGNGFTSTREFNSKKDKEPTFPLTIELNDGQYHYKYWQNGVLQMELPFTIKAGEKTTVKVK